jgi:predicted peroxiredoxin
MRARSTLFAATLILLSGIGFAVAQNEESKPHSRGLNQQTSVIHLSHFTDDLHRAFMAMKIAKMMQEGGVDTTLFLDIEGARISDSRQSLDVRWGPSPVALGELFNDFVKSGGKVVVCPHCAKVAGIKNEHARRGAKFATEEELGKMLVNADKIMDY